MGHMAVRQAARGNALTFHEEQKHMAERVFHFIAEILFTCLFSFTAIESLIQTIPFPADLALGDEVDRTLWHSWGVVVGERSGGIEEL